MARFRPLRQHRYDRLRAEGVTGAEAQAMSEFKFKQPYIRLMRIDRRELVRDVRRLGLSKRASLAELRNQVNTVYDINNWKDAYSMMRDYRERAIDLAWGFPMLYPRNFFLGNFPPIPKFHGF